MIKYIRRTPKELREFYATKLAFMDEGYPEHKAEERAWDILFAARRGRKERVQI